MNEDRDDSHLAAEYVLGLLDEDGKVLAQQRERLDPAFRSQVASWRERFAAFDETAPEVAPAADLWARIEQTAARPESADPEIAPEGVLHWFWSSLAVWRTATVAASVAALVFAVVAALSVQQAREIAARKPVYVAILVDDATRQAGAVINAFADGRAEMIPLTDIAVPQGRALEIWTLWDRAVGPRSIGLVDRARTTRLDLQKLPPTSADQLFEITLEPAGGSPTGRPTGPILFKGTTARTL